MSQSSGDNHNSTAGGRLKSVLFSFAVTAAFALGFYSLFLASVNANRVRPLTTEGLLRTATAADTEKIKIALGVLTEQDLVYVVLDASEVDPDLDVVFAAQSAARSLVDSGLAVSVRPLNPADPDFATIVAWNGVSQFPAVLVVKKEGGIVLVANDLSAENLLNAYNRVWGKTSSCAETKSAVY